MAHRAGHTGPQEQISTAMGLLERLRGAFQGKFTPDQAIISQLLNTRDPQAPVDFNQRLSQAFKQQGTTQQEADPLQQMRAVAAQLNLPVGPEDLFLGPAGVVRKVLRGPKAAKELLPRPTTSNIFQPGEFQPGASVLAQRALTKKPIQIGEIGKFNATAISEAPVFPALRFRGQVLRGTANEFHEDIILRHTPMFRAVAKREGKAVEDVVQDALRGFESQSPGKPFIRLQDMVDVEKQLSQRGLSAPQRGAKLGSIDTMLERERFLKETNEALQTLFEESKELPRVQGLGQGGLGTKPRMNASGAQLIFRGESAKDLLRKGDIHQVDTQQGKRVFELTPKGEVRIRKEG